MGPHRAARVVAASRDHRDRVARRRKLVAVEPADAWLLADATSTRAAHAEVECAPGQLGSAACPPLSSNNGWVLELHARLVLVVGELDRVPSRQEGIDTQDEHAVATEELQDPLDETGCVDRLRMELFYDVEELVVDLGRVLKLQLYSVQIREDILQRRFGGTMARRHRPSALPSAR